MSPTVHRLALLGFGPVGRSFSEILSEKSQQVEERYGLRLQIVAAVDRTGGAIDSDGLDPAALVAAKRAGGLSQYPVLGRIGLTGTEILSHTEVDTVLEATSVNMQDGEPGMSYVKQALSAGRNVVMANKGPLVLAYKDVSNLARSNGVSLKFSATLGGSMPTYNLGVRDLAGCTIERVEAVLNSTSHYILCRMNLGDTYEEALAEAQRIEIAERDPTLDVEGWDATNKMVILANSILNTPTTLADVSRTGITHLSAADLPMTMLATAERTDSGYRLAVAPVRLPEDHPLATLDPLSMAAIFYTDLIGPMMITVNERGPRPTAAAMLRDVIEIAGTSK